MDMAVRRVAEVSSPLPRIAAVDGLRAIAMTMVIAQHCKLLPFGWFGVWQFYVISGFVITRGFIFEEPKSVPPGLRFRRFLLRRFFRIVPLYCSYLMLNVVVLALMGNYGNFGDLIYLLTFTYNWHMIYDFWPGLGSWAPFGHLWTISVEEQFYLFYPLVALLLPRRFRVPVIVALIALTPFIRYFYAASLTLWRDDNLRNAFAVYAASFCHMDAFLTGALIAHLESRITGNDRLVRTFTMFAAGLFCVYCAIYVVLNVLIGKQGIDILKNVISGISFGAHREVFLYCVVDLLAATVLIYAIIGSPWLRGLGNRYLAAVGEISYGGYVFHLLILWAFKTQAEGLIEQHPVMRAVMFVIVFAVTVMLAHLSYHRYEAPMSRWGRSQIH